MSATPHADRSAATPAPPADDSPCQTLQVRAAGRDWTLLRAANLDELWEAMTDAGTDFDDERIPYWTELWPSSVVLADWLALRRNDIAGRRCLDLGCGLGLTALAARWLGATVVAVDYEAAALGFARRNARRNQVAQPGWTLMDWRRPGLRSGAFARIWGGDVVYERRFIAPLLRLLGHALAPGGAVWIAEPGRGVYDDFLRALHPSGWQARRVHASRTSALPGIACASDPLNGPEVSIWELQRRG